MPLVSIIIPAHNAQATLPFTLRSLLDQSLTDWEAVVVDDGSTDGTAGVLSDFSWRDERIRLLRSDRPGIAESCNAGIDAARGDYVQFLESGAWVTPLGTEHLLQAAEWSGRGAACGPVVLNGLDGRPFDVTVRTPASDMGAEEILAARSLAPSAHLVRRSALRDVRFDPSLRCFHDLDLRLRLASRGLRWASVEHAVGHARVRPGAKGRSLRRCLDTFMQVVGRSGAPSVSRQDAVRRSSLFFATAAALTETSGACTGAKAMLRLGETGPTAYSPDELGASAYWALVLGFAIPPRKIAPSIDAWLPRLERWWAMVSPDASSEAIRGLARAAIQPEMIADAMLSSIPDGSPAVLAGALGQNGRTLAASARSRGVRLTLRDDRMPKAGIERLIDADSTVLVAPSADGPIIEQLPRRARIVRWCEAHGALADQLVEHFRKLSSPAELTA